MRGRLRVGVGRVGRGVGVTSGFGNADCGMKSVDFGWSVLGVVVGLDD